MKLLILVGLVLVVARCATAKSSGQQAPPASMESGVMQSTAAYESFMKVTYNGQRLATPFCTLCSAFQHNPLSLMQTPAGVVAALDAVP